MPGFPAHAHANHNDILNLLNLKFQLHFYKGLKHLSMPRTRLQLSL